MNFLDSWVQSSSAKALGWTLVHSLWEGAAIALTLAIVLSIVRSSRIRYAAACVAMLGILVGFGLTLYRLAPNKITSPAAVHPLPAPVKLPVDNRPHANQSSPWDASQLPPWLAPVWLAGVLLFQLRCLISWTAAARLRRTGVCSPPPEWIGRLDELQRRLHMSRPVKLLESCFAEVPVVIGNLRPVILIPVGLLAGLPAAQVEAILLHELAHIRRADYLVNLLQTLVEGLLFYHPAVWWISSAIRTERENCCDDLVVLTNGDAHEYAIALTALAENRWTMPNAALAVTGGKLVKRIRRLLAQPDAQRSTPAPLLPVGILIVTGAVALMAWQSPAPPAPSPLINALPLALASEQTAQPAAPAASPYERWLREEAVYIITDKERAEFKNLQSDADRAHFIDEFWKRRDPTPGTPANEFKDEHYRRIAYVNGRFADSRLPGWKTDRGRIYIGYGPPDEIDSHPAGGAYTRPNEQGGAQTVTYPFEQWKYRHIENIGTNVIMEFVDKARNGEYRLTMDPAEKEVAQQVEQARLLERLAEVQHQLASDPPELKEQQIQAVEEQLRIVEKQMASLPDQIKRMESQVQAEQIQRELAKLGDLKELADVDREVQAQVEQLNVLRQKYTDDWPDVRRTRELIALAEQTRNGLLKEDQAARTSDSDTAVQARENSVFVSGSGSQAAVVILPNRHMLVTIPFEFPANHYSVTVSTFSSDGKTVWKETSTNGSHTMGGIALAPGSYTLNALVKDAAGPKQKTYVVNFSVK